MATYNVKNSVLFVPPWNYPHEPLTLKNVLAAQRATNARRRAAFEDNSQYMIVDVKDISSTRDASSMAIGEADSSDGSTTTETNDAAVEDLTVRSALTPRDEQEKTASSDGDSLTTGSSVIGTPRVDIKTEQISTATASTRNNQLATSSASIGAIAVTAAVEDDEPKVDPFASFTWQNPNLVAHNNETLLGYLRGGGGSYNESSLHNATWCGFGPIMRPKVWAARLTFALAEQIDLRTLVETRGLEYVDYMDIMKDMRRTYSALDELPPPYLSARRQSESIYRLLCAMASYNRSIGYAQAMNRLALVLVDVFDQPWQQFWAFDHILTRILPHYFMRKNSIGLLADISVLAYYVRRRDKQLSAALLKHDDSITRITNSVLYTLCVQWLTPMFVGFMRFGNVVRLWDSIIIHGAPALFTFIYRVLAFNRAAIVAAADITVILSHLNNWLENLESLDVIASVKMDKPIEAADVEARRASQLNALLTAQKDDRQFRKGISNSAIDGYVNLGRGCTCEHHSTLPHGVPSPPPLPTATRTIDTSAIRTSPFVATMTARTSTTTGTSTAIEVRPKRTASLPLWNLHRSVNEHSLLDGAGMLTYSDASFTTETMPLAAPLRGTSAATTRHNRSGTRVASSKTTIGSAVPTVDVKSNGTDG